MRAVSHSRFFLAALSVLRLIMGPPLEAIKWVHGPDRTSLALLDQRLLPHTMEYIDIPGADAGWTAIKVRGDAKGEGDG